MSTKKEKFEKVVSTVLREPESSISRKIKIKPLKELEEYFKRYEFKLKPTEHQLRSMYAVINNPALVLGLDMGLGKTKILIDSISIMKKQGLFTTTAKNGRKKKKIRALVIAPSAVVNQWELELPKHSDLTYQIIANSGRMSFWERGHLCHDTDDYDVTVVPHEWLRKQMTIALENKGVKTLPNGEENKFCDFDKLLKKGLSVFDVLVCDEAHRIYSSYSLPSSDSSNSGGFSVGFDVYKKYLLHIPRRYFLTGTPVKQDFTGLWALYYMLDKGETFGDDVEEFISKYFSINVGVKKSRVVNGKANLMFLRSLVPNEDSIEDIKSKFWRLVIRWETNEVISLPKLNYKPVIVPLGEEMADLYVRVVDSPSGSGFYKGVTGYDARLMLTTAGIGLNQSPKLQELAKIIRGECVTKRRPVVVWTWLRMENNFVVEKLKNQFPKLRIERFMGDDPKYVKKNLLEDWNNGKVDVIVANQLAGGTGIELSKSSVAVYFSNGRSFIDRNQSIKRIHRIGQKQECFVYDLMVGNTIDELIVEGLRASEQTSRRISGDETTMRGLKVLSHSEFKDRIQEQKQVIQGMRRRKKAELVGKSS